MQGIVANHQRLNELMAQSLMLVTALVPHIGYDCAAEISQHAQRDGCSLKEAALALGYVTPEDYERWVVVADMARPPSN